MNIWVFLIVAVIVTVGIPAIAGIVSEYKLAKSKQSDNSDELLAMKSEMRKLKKRLENLEAIAAGDPDNFSKDAAETETNFTADRTSHAEEIENILKRKRTR